MGTGAVRGMKNSLRGQSEIVAGSATYRLVFDIEALCLLEAALSATTDAIILALEADTVDIARVRAAVWAGLQSHHPCPLVTASNVVTAAGYPDSKAAVMAGLRGAFGVAEDGDGAHPRMPGRRPGGWIYWKAIVRRAVARIGSGVRRRD